MVECGSGGSGGSGGVWECMSGRRIVHACKTDRQTQMRTMPCRNASYRGVQILSHL